MIKKLKVLFIFLIVNYLIFWIVIWGRASKWW
jgi:hypothetical protein